VERLDLQVLECGCAQSRVIPRDAVKPFHWDCLNSSCASREVFSIARSAYCRHMRGMPLLGVIFVWDGVIVDASRVPGLCWDDSRLGEVTVAERRALVTP